MRGQLDWISSPRAYQETTGRVQSWTERLWKGQTVPPADPAVRGLQGCVHPVALDSRCIGNGAFPGSPIKEAETSEMLPVADPHCLAAQAQLSWAVSSAQNWLQEQTGLDGTRQGAASSIYYFRDQNHFLVLNSGTLLPYTHLCDWKSV